jgi:hypothetical protein
MRLPLRRKLSVGLSCCAARNSDEHDEALLSIALLAKVLPLLRQELDRAAWHG